MNWVSASATAAAAALYAVSQLRAENIALKEELAETNSKRDALEAELGRREASSKRLKAENNALKEKLTVANTKLSTRSKWEADLPMQMQDANMRMRDMIDRMRRTREVLAAPNREPDSGDGKRVSLEDAEDAARDADSET